MLKETKPEETIDFVVIFIIGGSGISNGQANPLAMPTISDANLLLFDKICRFFDQIGQFCKSSRTDEKNFGVWGSWVTVNMCSLFKG